MQDRTCLKCGLATKLHNLRTGECPRRQEGAVPGFYVAGDEIHVEPNEICRAFGWRETAENLEFIMRHVAKTTQAEVPDCEIIELEAAPDGLREDVEKIVRRYQAEKN